MMRGALGLLGVALFSLGTAQARLGESEEQIQTRYGAAVAVLPGRPGEAGLTKCYSSGGYLIAVTYLGGRSAREMLTKSDNSKITPAEIQKLLNARTTGVSWTVQDVAGPQHLTAGVQQWRSIDQDSRVAIYDSQTRALFVTTQQFIDLTNTKKQRSLTRANADALGTRGRPLQRMSILERGSVLRAIGRNQPKPAATPAK